MKKSLLLVFVVFVSLASCKKSDSVTSANTLSATIDGVSESFNTGVSAQNGTLISLNSVLSILGSSGNTADADVLSITLNTNSTIAAGTYTNAATSNNGFISISYTKGPVNLSNLNTYSSDVQGVYLTIVKIVSISSTNVQGTFSGKLLYTDGKTVKSITDGKFNVKLN